MTTHAKYFSPSSADRWMTCTASAKLIDSLNLPDSSSEAAEEGSAAHELLDLSLKRGVHPRKFKGKTFNKTWEATSEMVNKVGLVWEWVMGKVLDGYELKCERKVKIDCTGDTGTMDISLRRLRHLITADLKYGRGIVVSPDENKQMCLYTCGVLDEDKLWDEIDEVTLVIWQPRLCEEAQEFDTSVEALQYFQADVRSKVRDINANKTTFVPGEKQCQWCRAKPVCEDHAKWITKKVGADFDSVVGDRQVFNGKSDIAHRLSVMPADQIFNIWQHSDALHSWLKSVHEHIVERVKQNDPEYKAFGLKMVEGKSNRRWRDPEQTMAALRKMKFDIDEFAPRSLVGLGAVEDLFPTKKAAAEFLNVHTIKPPGAPTLATADDERPEIKTVDQMFDDLDNL